MRYLKQIIGLIVILGIFADCNKDENRNDTSHLKFLLTDAPGMFEEVNIDIVGIHIILNDSLMELETNSGIYNLLDFVNGNDTILVTEDVPNGYLSQVRLILGQNNTVKVDGEIFDIKTPSAQESGLKFNVHEEFIPNITYTYVLDFDACRSIVETGNGKNILKPVIRVFSEAVTGAIEGVVMPIEATPVISAINAGDTTTTLTNNETGEFMLRGLKEGTYQLDFNVNTPYSDTTLKDIEVLNGIVTVLDTLWIQQ
ncbi:MAG: DUF4382 domain-containing protein [Bacteroidales bacterium]|nr:DUF4382 domain-containing protein [Bacteroidales bacterium]